MEWIKRKRKKLTNYVVRKLCKNVPKSWVNKFNFKAGNPMCRLKIDCCINKTFKKAGFYLQSKT